MYWEDIEIDNLPEGKVLARTDDGEMFYGLLRIRDGGDVGCFYNGWCRIDNVTKYVDPKKIINRNEEKARYLETKKHIEAYFKNMSKEDKKKLLDRCLPEEKGEKRTCSYCLEVFHSKDIGNVEETNYFCSGECRFAN